MHALRSLAAMVIGSAALLAGVGVAPGAAQQTGTIRGTVIEASTSRPLSGVQVFIPGTRLVAVTNDQGEFTMSNVPVGRVDVTARFVGYTGKSTSGLVAAEEALSLDFSLNQSVIKLDEIVVTGAGGQVEKRQLGNTIATIDAADLKIAPIATFSEAIAAREAGVSLLPSGGLPGEGARIRIRGNASLSQNNEPVVYLDGVRVDNGGGFTGVGAGGGGSPSRLDDINPEMIERVEVLKGAAAATLYGSEASAGVIQIFTKRGRQGAPRFSFRLDQGVSRYPNVMKPQAGFARTQAQADTLNGIFRSAQPITPYSVFERTSVSDLFGTGYNSTYSGTVAGGGETATYNVAGRYARDDGPLAAAHLGPGGADVSRRVFASANVDIFPIERLKIAVGGFFTDAHQATPENNNNIYGLISSALNSKPEGANCRESMRRGLGGSFGEDPATPGACASAGNPLGNLAFTTTREAAQSVITQDAEHFNGNVRLSYTPIQTLKLETTFGADVVNTNDANLLAFGYNVDNFVNNNNLGYKGIGNRNHREVSLDSKASWSAQLGVVSSALVLGGQGFVTKDRVKTGFGFDFPGPGLEVAGAGANRSVSESYTSVVNLGLFGQEQVGFNQWAFVTLGARWDKNSAFGQNTAGALYPKASVSIVPSSIRAWPKWFLSTARIRGAVGRSGLQPGAFDKLTTFSALSSELGAGLAPENLGNPDLKPEVTTEYEGGVEFGLFGNRLGLDVTRWHRTTTDALVARQFPVTGGFRGTQLDNVGKLEGQGWDFKVNALIMDRSRLSVSVFANAAYLKQTILDMGGAPPIKVGLSYPRYRNFLRGPDTLVTASGGIAKIVFYAPGALLGAQLIQPCGGERLFQKGSEKTPRTRLCMNPGQNPYDTNRDGQPDTDDELLAFLTVPRGLDIAQMQPLMDDQDGDGDLLDHYLGKPVPDWQGAFGANLSLFRNFQVSALFEYKFGNFTVTNLTDAFRKSHPLIGRNIKAVAEVEAIMLNPDSRPEQRLEAAREWASKYKALSPYDGLNQNENGDFVRFRELGITYTFPSTFAQRLGFSDIAINVTGRNLAMLTGYTGIDPEINQVGRGGGSALENNYLDSVDAWGVPIPTRYTISVRFGF